MSEAYLAGTLKHLPAAEITFDRYHIKQHLSKAIDELGTGDILVVAEWDRATRSMLDGVHIIDDIELSRCERKPAD